MFIALIVLWISWLSLVLLGYLDNPAQYLMNEKLWAKFTVVSALTLNGIALHYFSFPRITCMCGFLLVPGFEQILVVLTGVISSVSWLFACYLGIACPWNYTVGYSDIILITAVCLPAQLLWPERHCAPYAALRPHYLRNGCR